MGIDVQCGGGRHMADDGGQRLDVHAVFQRVGGEGMPQVVKADVLAVRPIQNLGQLLPDGGRVQWGVLLFRRREHPPGTDALPVVSQDTQNGGWQDDAPTRALCLRGGDHQFPAHPLDLPFDPQYSCAEIQVIPLEGQDLAPAQTSREF